MPIYEYECQKCDHKFEVFLIKSDDKAECPQCGAQEPIIEKQIPKLTSAILKGTGWYRDGYKGRK